MPGRKKGPAPTPPGSLRSQGHPDVFGVTPTSIQNRPVTAMASLPKPFNPYDQFQKEEVDDHQSGLRTSAVYETLPDARFNGFGEKSQILVNYILVKVIYYAGTYIIYRED